MSENYPAEWKQDGKVHTTEEGDVWWTGDHWSLTKIRAKAHTNGDNINIVLDRTQIEKDMQTELDAEKLENEKLRSTISLSLSPEMFKRHNEIFGDSKRGGGVTKLVEYHGKAGQYETVEQGFNELQNRANAKDGVARSQLDKLKEMATKSVIKDYLQNGKALHLVECPVCRGMINYGEGERECPKCGWDKFKGYDG